MPLSNQPHTESVTEEALSGDITVAELSTIDRAIERLKQSQASLKALHDTTYLSDSSTSEVPHSFTVSPSTSCSPSPPSPNSQLANENPSLDLLYIAMNAKLTFLLKPGPALVELSVLPTPSPPPPPKARKSSIRSNTPRKKTSVSLHTASFQHRQLPPERSHYGEFRAEFGGLDVPKQGKRPLAYLWELDRLHGSPTSTPSDLAELDGHQDRATIRHRSAVKRILAVWDFRKTKQPHSGIKLYFPPEDGPGSDRGRGVAAAARRKRRSSPHPNTIARSEWGELDYHSPKTVKGNIRMLREAESRADDVGRDEEGHVNPELWTGDADPVSREIAIAFRRARDLEEDSVHPWQHEVLCDSSGDDEEAKQSKESAESVPMPGAPPVLLVPGVEDPDDGPVPHAFVPEEDGGTGAEEPVMPARLWNEIDRWVAGGNTDDGPSETEAADIPPAYGEAQTETATSDVHVEEREIVPSDEED